MIDAEQLIKELRPGRIFVITNELDGVIAAFTGMPNTGVERLIQALGLWKCSDPRPHKCLAVHVHENSVMVVRPDIDRIPATPDGEQLMEPQGAADGEADRRRWRHLAQHLCYKSGHGQHRMLTDPRRCGQCEALLDR